MDAERERLSELLRTFRERLQAEEGIGSPTAIDPSALPAATNGHAPDRTTLPPVGNGHTLDLPPAPVHPEQSVGETRGVRPAVARPASRPRRRVHAAVTSRPTAQAPVARVASASRPEPTWSRNRAAGPQPSADRESEIRSYLEVLWRRKSLVAITAVLTLVVAIAGTLLMKPVYASSVTLQVKTSTNQFQGVEYDTINYAERRMNTFKSIATSRPVLSELSRRLGVAEPPPVKVEIPANTELLKVTVEGGSPEAATLGAATLSDILVAQFGSGTSKVAQDLLRERLAQLEQEIRASEPGPASDGKKDAYGRLLEEYERATINDAARASSIAVVEPAMPPLGPVRPNRTMNLALGLVIGLVAGIGLTFLFESLDTRLHSVDRIQSLTGLPILGIVPAGPNKQRVLFDERSPQQEAVRRLRTQLLLPDRGGSLQTVVVTSAEPGEGKSTILANLAVSLARAKKNVLIVDADMRLPTAHQFFGVSNETGLSRILRGEATWVDEVRYVPSAGVWVLPSGPMPRNPSELLGSQAMTELLEQLKAKFELVLIDSPSLLAVSDGSVLTTLADAVVLVVAQGQAKAEAVRAACQELANVRVEPLVVVNRADQERVYGYYPQATHAQGQGA